MRTVDQVQENFHRTREDVGYVPRSQAPPSLYRELGFKCGLEVHQQLNTEGKLFCRCPAGIYHDFDDFDAEIVRHMRPTLSELGEYDGTALMEFKTRKEILYRINNQTACTYEIDDTPPFRVNEKALGIALRIALLFRTNIVGEFHITRKQYLDGSIPTGFQRTGIIGVEGQFRVGDKRVRVIQLSLEEDSCREVSDIGHQRIFATDRLGIPLIETVTYPDMKTPSEAYQAGQYIRFITRSSGLVRTGIGAAREDVNVSITGGTRVEIKGVAHITWIPRLTHNEAFRQKALLRIRDLLLSRIKDPQNWKPVSLIVTSWLKEDPLAAQSSFISEAPSSEFLAINLPRFRGVLSHFLLPGLSFASELENRLKVIACIEKPNMTSDESLNPVLPAETMARLRKKMKCRVDDALVILKGPDRDMKTARETIEERCGLAFEGVPNETRKALPSGTTIFERVLPGPDRMYPDTDSAPIPIEDKLIEEKRRPPVPPPHERIDQLLQWGVPTDIHIYLMKKNRFPLLKKLAETTGYPPALIGKLLGQNVKYIEGQSENQTDFPPRLLEELFTAVQDQGLHPDILPDLIPPVYREKRCALPSQLNAIGYRKASGQEIQEEMQNLVARAASEVRSGLPEARIRWIMGKIRPLARGNYSLARLQQEVSGEING